MPLSLYNPGYTVADDTVHRRRTRADEFRLLSPSTGNNLNGIVGMYVVYRSYRQSRTTKAAWHVHVISGRGNHDYSEPRVLSKTSDRK